MLTEIKKVSGGTSVFNTYFTGPNSDSNPSSYKIINYISDIDVKQQISHCNVTFKDFIHVEHKLHFH
jgi:hypothetical protein